MMKKIIIVLVLLAFLPLILSSQKLEFSFFRESDILKPFLSEIKSTIVKCELAYLNKLDDNYYLSNYTSRPFVEAHLGAEAPFFSFIDRPHKIKFSTGGYIGNILLIDMLESMTSPIINTDYFFGLQVNTIKYINNRYIRNAGIKFVPIFHESTHLGDEFSLHGYKNVSDFRRVNVSYEAWEIAFVLNDPDTIKTNLLSVKAGFHGLWNDARGYYNTDSLETKGAIVPSSEKNYEYYFQINLQRTQGLLCSEKWMQVLSIEANNRLKFSYDLDVPEKRTWNFNIYFGWQHITKPSGRNIGFFIRYYNGIIPNGQFRNVSGYQYAALSILYN